jgi:autotransporter-associated beta strand protein
MVVPPTSANCSGAGVAMTASGADTYSWLPNTALAPNNTSTTVTATPTSNTTYTVTGTDVNGCVNTATQTVNVGSNPVMGAVTATPSTVCENGSSNLSASATIPGYVQGVGGSSFIDISVTGTSVGTPTDDSEHQVTIPSFTYNGTAYTQMRIGNNGKVVFDQPSTGTFSGTIAGSGSVVVQNAGTLVLTGTNTYSGGTTVAGGTLLLSGNGTLGTSTVSISGGTLDMGGKSLANTFGSLTGGTLSNVIEFDGGALTVGSTIAPDTALGSRFNFAFERCTVRWRGLTVPLPPVGKGWGELLYLDDELRIQKDVRGDIVIATKVR